MTPTWFQRKGSVSPGRRVNVMPTMRSILVAVGLMTLIVTAMLGLDDVFFFSALEPRKVIDTIEKAQRSIVFLNDARTQVNHGDVASVKRASDQVMKLVAAGDSDHGPIVTDQAEREEWIRLEGLLRQLSAHAQPPSSDLVAEINKSIDTLLSTNSMIEGANVAALRAAYQRAVWSDVIGDAIVLAIVSIICVWLLRALGRQRRLVAQRVQFLDEKNAELEAFAGRAAHDLRGPMNPIRGYTDLILEAQGLPDEVSTMAQRIRRAVDRMARVVDDMLALSTSGRPPPGESSSTVVVSRMIEEMGAELHGVEVVTKLAGGRVACGEGILTQILRNLLGNAIKFRARSRPLKVTIETRDVGSMVEFTIEDNGAGMDPQSAKHAFEPFYRGQMDRELPGHGLGLAIVDRATRALGGTCELSSVLDLSTRIVVRLPRA